VSNVLRIRNIAIQEGAAVIVLSSQPRDTSQVNLATMREIDGELGAVVGMCFLEAHEALADDYGTLSSTADSWDGIQLNVAVHAMVLQVLNSRIASGQCIQLFTD
jgi:hypothetical protein